MKNRRREVGSEEGVVVEESTGDDNDSDYVEERESIKGKGAETEVVSCVPPCWLTDGTPPPVDQRALILIERLAHITELDYLQNLVVLSKRLVQPDSIKPTPSDSLAMAVRDYAQKISNATLASFHEMMALIRLAFLIER